MISATGSSVRDPCTQQSFIKSRSPHLLVYSGGGGLSYRRPYGQNDDTELSKECSVAVEEMLDAFRR